MDLNLTVTFAAGSGAFDRAAHLRGAVRRLLRDPNAELLPFWEGRPMLAQGDGWLRLGWIAPTERALKLATEAPVFLGLYDGTPRFAADFSTLPRERLESMFIAGAKFTDLRAVAGELGAGEATVAATAKGVLGWHATHRFCANCGAESGIEEAGWRRRCPDCERLHFPRIDPVVIMLVTHEDRVLLGRSAQFPDGLYSLLAGYMEPGETIEDAVRRETLEEAGIRVGRVRYLACQPWPFPSSLMLGCAGAALEDDIAIDMHELEDALWVPRSDVPDILAGKHLQLAAPRVSAIARTLLAAWSAGEIEGF